jgi:hypothetical protein
MGDRQNLRVRGREEEGKKMFIELKRWYVK